MAYPGFSAPVLHDAPSLRKSVASVDATLILVRANRLDVLLDSIRFLLAGHAVGGENQVMSRTLRASAGGYCYHVLIGRNERSRVFHDAHDFPKNNPE